MLTPADVDPRTGIQDTERSVNVGDQERLLKLMSWINLESRTGCSGAVLTYLHRRQASAIFPGELAAAAFQVRRLEQYSLKDTMFVSADTLSSLQIVASHTHPTFHNQSPRHPASGAKEGLSVHGLFHHLAGTPQGRSMLRQWFLRPSVDESVINERLNSITAFTKPVNQTSMSTLVKVLKKVQNMKRVMTHLRKGVSPCSTGSSGGIRRGIWASLRQILILKFAFCAIKIREVLLDIHGGKELRIFQKVLSNFDPRIFQHIGSEITETVDFAQSKEQGRTVVRSGVDRDLDRKRHEYDGLDSLLSHVAERIATEYDIGDEVDLSVIYFPQIGYLIVLPFNIETGSVDCRATSDPDEIWERMFSTESKVYYKSDEMRDMDEELGDMWGIIVGSQTFKLNCSKLVRTSARNLTGSEPLFQSRRMVLIKIVISILAFAQGAQQLKLARPQIVEDNVIQIEGGR
ncbi:MAG: hypothetical protein M1825_003060 [Sarcosagium campestre]|nr:MAG: hypothetical protein M1825_003060 [Sarcosagium campestre]